MGGQEENSNFSYRISNGYVVLLLYLPVGGSTNKAGVREERLWFRAWRISVARFRLPDPQNGKGLNIISSMIIIFIFSNKNFTDKHGEYSSVKQNTPNHWIAPKHSDFRMN